jgi:uncharacterized membrane protein
VSELITLCDKFPQEAVDYLFNSDITQWLLGQGRTDLANESREIVSTYMQEKYKGLELFVRKLCKSEGLPPYPKIFLQPDKLYFGEIPVGYQETLELEINNNGRGFAWGSVKVSPYLSGVIVPKTFDSSTRTFSIQLDTLAVKPGSYKDDIGIKLEGIEEPCLIHLEYTVSKIQVVAPSKLELGDVSDARDSVTASFSIRCETSNGRIAGKIRGTASNQLTKLIKVKPLSFEGALIEFSVILDTKSLEAGLYEDTISLETSAGQFKVIVSFKKRIRWNIITKYALLFAIGIGLFMGLIRLAIALVIKVDNLWVLSYPSAIANSSPFSSYCSNVSNITIEDIVSRSANLGAILSLMMILIIPKLRNYFWNVLSYGTHISNTFIDNELIHIILVIGCVLLLYYLGLITNFFSFIFLSFVIIIELFAHSFIWISIKQPSLAWLLIGFFIGGFLGIILALQVIKQNSSIFRVGIIAIVIAVVLASTGYGATKLKQDTCHFKTNVNQEYLTFMQTKNISF